MKDWADEYGPIYKFEILGMTHVVLCTQDIANDLLALNGAIYSDRPYMTMAYELVSRTGNLATAPNGKYWRNARKFAHTHLSSAAAANTWMPVQAAEAPRLVCDLVKDPENYAYFFERFSTLVSLRMGFGKKVPPGPEEAQHVNTIMTITHTIERTVAPGAYLVDFVPALKYLPEFLARFKAEARDLFDYEWSYFTGLMSDAHKSMIVGEVQSPPCFAHSYFAKKDAYDLSEFEATYTLGTLFEGGSGTTSAAMQSFCLAMGHYPEWQAKTQKEIDDVVGSHRLPSFDDMPNLPIVRAVIKETLRWRPVVPGGSCTPLRLSTFERVFDRTANQVSFPQVFLIG
jgi:cytochrome P450